jgi:hypothetical protein
MQKLRVATVIAAATFAISDAYAQGGDKPADAAAPTVGKMEMPKPTPELEAAAKSMAGKWKCAGKDEGSPMAPAHKIEATMTWKPDLDKFWIVGTYEEKKTKENPHPFKFFEYRTYDATTKKWASVMVDNVGMFSMGTGESDGKVTKWDSKSNGMGMSVAMRITDEMKSAKEVHVSGEAAMDGTNFKPMFDVTCKK